MKGRLFLPMPKKNVDKKTRMFFAAQMQQLLNDKKLNAAELSRRIPVSDTTIRNWLAGKFLPNSGELIELREFFKISIDSLFPELSLEEPQKGDEGHNVIPMRHVKYNPGNIYLHDAMEDVLKTDDTDARKTIEKVLRGLMSDIKGELEQRQDIKEMKVLLRKLVDKLVERES